MAKAETTVWNVMLNEVLFGLIVDALSVFQKEQHRLCGLVPMMLDYLERSDLPNEQIASSILALGPLTGEIRLSLRLPAGHPRIAELRDLLSDFLGKPCTIREIVALAALSRTYNGANSS